jgi:hypothetical protein
MFCASGLVFDGTEGVRSRFHVLRVRTRFRRYRVGRVPFSCSAIPDSFSAVPRASGPIFLFYTPGLVFSDVECVGSLFHVLRSWIHFRRYRGRRVPISCFARPDSFSTISRASGPVFMFCAPRLVFDGTEGVGSRFHVLRLRTRFRRYRGRRVPFSCFARTDSFSAVPGRRVPFSSFALPYSFSAVSRAPFFMFCAPGLIFGDTEVVGSRFHVLRSRTHFQRDRERVVPFSGFVLPNSFSAAPRASGPFSCFSRPDSFSAVLSASGPFFMFCAP